ncbi:MAG: hypothetical protein U9P36_02495 [Thermodesulfobacteriota bacterium]|nr:hypothetical protein [Thermodesulfobacteriota bacterium]
MTDKTDQIEKIKASIEQMRDEIMLKAHLGKADAKDELAELEKKWDSFLADHKPLADEATNTAAKAGAALLEVGEELKAGYKRMRKHF